ncbi:MAG: ankyrin repeat domain-containing protein, partial [Gluconacetobacter diazotrophicus]|nr:ankyrin repeat domain-containing protein [Gluconacetobacter diazotrophicus]
DPWRHSFTAGGQLGGEALAGLVKDRRTDFLDALIAARFDLGRLTKAAVAADPATAAWIARRVAEVNKQRADIAALETAAADNDLPAMGRLVDGGVDVNGVGADDNTPLVRAVFKNRLEAARWLLDHGAQVDKPRLPGWNFTPLCLVNSVPMAELLKARGADVHAKLYGRDVSILTYVAEFAKADVVAWFLQQGLDANLLGDNRGNLLFGLRDAATAEVLLAAGTDPNHADEFGRTPLAAAQSGEVVRALVRHGADLKPRLQDGTTLLEDAANNTRRADDTPQEQAGYIEELIRQGAEFDPKGNGVRAMISAAFHDRVGEVQAFLDHGVSPDAAYERGSYQHESALSAAAPYAPKTLKLLLERGANPNAPVPAGQITPLDAALARRAFTNVDLLRQAGAKGLTDLAYYSAKGDAAKVGELLAAHADPNEAGSSGWTPLIYAVRCAQVGSAQQLLDAGASVDQFEGFGLSAYLEFLLLQSTIAYSPEQVQMQWHLPEPEVKVRLAAFQELFARHPPDFTYRNRAGRTALHQAVWAGNSAVTGLMLQGQPPRFDPNLPDGEGKTPLLLAALSPVARDTQEIITTDVDAPQQKKWNQQAYLASELLGAGARLDLAVAGSRTVGELALAAARDAGNVQLAGVLTDAMHAKPAPGSPPPADPPRDLSDLAPDRRDAILAAARAAIQAGDLPTLDGFLRRGLDPNAEEQGYSSLLFLAADAGRPEAVKLLLAHGADFLQKTSWGDTPLRRACWRGYKEAADALLAAGAPNDELAYAAGTGDVAALTARDARQPITPEEARGKLYFAVASGHPDTFDFLWRKLGSLDDTARGKLLGDLYENAGKWGHANLLPVLEALGASPARDGPRALNQAIGWNYPEVVKALLERGVPLPSSSHAGPLRNAAGEGHLEIVRLLLDGGADINAQDDHGFTPLAWAAYEGREDACLLLLDRGADGGIKDRDGRNAAWHAAAGPHCPEALARMIQAGVPVTGKDTLGETILDHLMRFSTPDAALHGEFFGKYYSPAELARFDANERKVTEQLLAAGADPKESKHGLLAGAMYSEHYAAARVLLAHGADPALPDQNGDDALFALVSYAPDGPLPLDLFKTLLQRDGRPNPEAVVPNVTPTQKTTLLDDLLAWASRNPLRTPSFGEAVKIMLDGGAKFAGVDDAPAQALLQAAARGDLAAVERSVGQGAPVNTAGGRGWDALTVALSLGYDDCAAWLLDHGADVDGHSPDAVDSPLMFAVQRGRTELVERLLGQGAKIKAGYDALYWAVDGRNARVFDALLRAGADPKAVPEETMSYGGKTYTPH